MNSATRSYRVEKAAQAPTRFHTPVSLLASLISLPPRHGLSLTLCLSSFRCLHSVPPFLLSDRHFPTSSPCLFFSFSQAIPAFGGSSRGSQGNTADLQNSRTGLSQQGTCSRSSSGAPLHSGGKSQSPVEGSLSHQGGKGGEEVPMGEVKHVPWESFPQIMHVVASKRFSEHVLVKVSACDGG